MKPIIISILIPIVTYAIFSLAVVKCLENESKKDAQLFTAHNEIYHIIKANVEGQKDVTKSNLTDENVFVRSDGSVYYQIYFGKENFVQVTTNDLFQNYNITMQVEVTAASLLDNGTKAFDEIIEKEAACLAGLDEYLGIDITSDNLLLGDDEELKRELLTPEYRATRSKYIKGRSVNYVFGKAGAGIHYVDISIMKKHVVIQ